VPYLIIFTRHPGTDPSARYLLAHAAHLAQDGHQITLYLTGPAACPEGAASVRARGLENVYLLSEDLSFTSVRKRAGATRRTRRKAEPAPPPATERDDGFRTPSQLSADMLSPGWQVYWC
jgi:hypothetical protein